MNCSCSEIFQGGGIITRGDLQKAPVRMWLFGVIPLIEMQLLRIIRDRFPGDSWRESISDKRLEKAEELLKERKQKNIEIDLPDCLQFCDKRDIVLANGDLRRALGFDSRPKGKALLKNLEDLRDVLAHAQDIITGRWPEIVALASSDDDPTLPQPEWRAARHRLRQTSPERYIEGTGRCPVQLHRALRRCP